MRYGKAKNGERFSVFVFFSMVFFWGAYYHHITSPSEIFYFLPENLRWTGDNKNFADGLVIISDGLKNFANPVAVRGNSGVNKAGPYGFRFRES